MKSISAHHKQITGSALECRRSAGSRLLLLLALLMPTSFGLLGCGQSAKSIVAPSANMVNSYFGGPFTSAGSPLFKSSSTFDHSTAEIAVSSFVTISSAQVPTKILSGTFLSTPTGFLSITEDFASTSSTVLAAQNPPLTGAWAVGIPGAGALANLLNVNTSQIPAVVSAGPAAMTENTSCPNSSGPIPFLYSVVPTASAVADTADYGKVAISNEGSDITFDATPSLVGALPQPSSSVTGGCSSTIFGSLTAFPLNSFGTPSNLELIAVGSSGLLTSSFVPGNGNSLGAFGGGSGVIGVAAPSGPVQIDAVLGAKYDGFVYAPQSTALAPYDVTMLASAFGDDTASSQPCSMLQSSLAANSGGGAKTVAALPSANTLYGGHFLNSTGTANDPTGAAGSETCDVAIDFGNQDPANNGLFPNATIFVGSNYPPFSTSNPWNCFGTKLACAVSFPAAAIVGQVNGQYVIFVVASSMSSPVAQLPDNSGGLVPQPVGVYLFQKPQ